MSLFQPTNIIPSTFSGLRNSVVDTSSNISISWQVNGNSPMTGYKIDILQNNAASTSVHSTGLISISSSPFYPVDEKGNPQVFTYQPLNTTWASWGLSNGNSYKVKITQYWTQSTTNDNLVEQNSLSVFNTALTPSLTVSINGSIMVAGTPSAIETAYANFTATLSESNAVIAVRWIIAANDNGTRTVLEDTGFITTSQLKYEYVGLFDNSSYSIKCMFQLANGYSSEDTAQWFDFNVEYAETYEYSGEFTSTCVSAENANLLTWEEVEAIPGIALGGYEFVSDGIKLDSGTTITWDTVVQGDTQTGLSFSAPWTAVIKGEVGVSISKTQSYTGELYSQAYLADDIRNKNIVSLSNDWLVCGGWVFSFSGGVAVAKSNYFPRQAGKTLLASVLIGNTIYALDKDEINLYSINSSGQTSLIATQTIPVAGGNAHSMAVSSDGKWIVIDKGVIYKYENNSFTRYRWVNDLIGSERIMFINTSVGEYFFADKYLYKVSDLENLEPYATNPDAWWQPWKKISEQTIAKASCYKSGDYFAIIDTSLRVIKITGNDIVEVRSAILEGSGNIQFLNKKTIANIPNTGDEIRLYSISGTTEEKIIKKEVLNNAQALMGYPAVCGNDNYLVLMQKSDEVEFQIYNLNFSPSGQISSIGEITVEINGSSSVDPFIKILNKTFYYDYATGYYTIVITPVEIVLTQYVTDYMNQWQGRIVARDTVSSAQSAITSIVLGSVAQTAREISVYQGEVGDNIDLYTDYNFIPRFGAEDYILYFSARFNGDLEGGTGTSNGTGFQLYRNEVGSNSLFLLATLDANITQLKDYTAKSQTAYEYSLFVFDHNGAFMDKVELASSVCTKYRSFMLYETTPDNTLPNVFHVLNVWKFGNNINGGSYTNNNNPQWQKNFTKYPLKQPTTELYQSGTLTALLSNVNNYAYADTAEQMQRLSNISASTNTFFLKDTKGNLFMVGIGGAITQTINTKTGVQEVTVSIPWKEVGDASNVSVVSIPTDDGWSN